MPPARAQGTEFARASRRPLRCRATARSVRLHRRCVRRSRPPCIGSAPATSRRSTARRAGSRPRSSRRACRQRITAARYHCRTPGLLLLNDRTTATTSPVQSSHRRHFAIESKDCTMNTSKHLTRVLGFAAMAAVALGFASAAEASPVPPKASAALLGTWVNTNAEQQQRQAGHRLAAAYRHRVGRRIRRLRAHVLRMGQRARNRVRHRRVRHVRRELPDEPALPQRRHRVVAHDPARHRRQDEGRPAPHPSRADRVRGRFGTQELRRHRDLRAQRRQQGDRHRQPGERLPRTARRRRWCPARSATGRTSRRPVA